MCLKENGRKYSENQIANSGCHLNHFEQCLEGDKKSISHLFITINQIILKTCAFKSSNTLIPALVFLFKIYISKSNETSILDSTASKEHITFKWSLLFLQRWFHDRQFYVNPWTLKICRYERINEKNSHLLR